MLWTVIVPMSPLDRAKTRLADASSSPARHRALVRAMRRDTVRAVLGGRDVARLVVVTGTPDAALADLADLPDLADRAGVAVLAPAAAGAPAIAGAGACVTDRVHVVADPPHDGLNPAVNHAAGYAATTWPENAIAVVVADLAALTAPAIDLVLAAADAVDRGVVVDRQGMGTTMLTALPAHPVRPRFGPGSARRHVELGATRLSAPLPARTDVDVLEDLDAARRLGFGPAMAALFQAGELPLMPAQGRVDAVNHRAIRTSARVHPDGA